MCALKRQGDEETARVSLYHTHASAAGEGVVAYVSIRGADDRWRPIVGGADRSSFVVALAETFITPA